MIPTSHEKVYPGWGISGLGQLDNFVVDHVWERMDELIRRVQHVDVRDIMYHNPNVIVESVCGFGDLKKIFDKVLGKW